MTESRPNSRAMSPVGSPGAPPPTPVTRPESPAAKGGRPAAMSRYSGPPAVDSPFQFGPGTSGSPSARGNGGGPNGVLPIMASSPSSIPHRTKPSTPGLRTLDGAASGSQSAGVRVSGAGVEESANASSLPTTPIASKYSVTRLSDDGE